jgi:hypothetical protein
MTRAKGAHGWAECQEDGPRIELGGWNSDRVGPIGDDWIEAHRRVVVEQLLR